MNTDSHLGNLDFASVLTNVVNWLRQATVCRWW